MKLRMAALLLAMAWSVTGSRICATSHPLDSLGIFDSISGSLRVATGAADSMRLMMDLYDISSNHSYRNAIGSELLDLAVKNGDSDIGLDVLRNLANLHLRNDSLLEWDLAHIKMFKPSADRDETETFIRMIRNLNQVRFADNATKVERLHKLLEYLDSDPDMNIYDRIVTLHAVCLYIGDISQGEVMEPYMERLGEAVEGLRKEAYAIRNCYYVQSALYYRQCGKYDKAVEIDRRLLKAIKALESGSEGSRRRYRNYDTNKYVVYTRLLSNFRTLPPDEVERYYSKIMDLTSRNYRARMTMEASGRPEIYYAMFRKDYARALALLKEHIDSPYNCNYRRVMLHDMMECAESVGDKETLLRASKEYAKVLEQTMAQRLEERVKELQIVYDINSIKAEKAEQEARMQHRWLTTMIVAAFILLILLAFMFMLYRRARNLAGHLDDSNRALKTKSHNLQRAQTDIIKARDEARAASRVKSDFIRNMSGEVAVPLHMINEYSNLIVDCAEASDKPYLNHFAECISFNAEILSAIVNDVLHLSEIDSDTIVIERKKVDLRSICNMALECINHRVDKGVSLRMNPAADDVTVDTDPRRLSQILFQLLTNASKFTHSGEISLSYKVDRAENKVHIYVSDTGPGIAPENSERIFDRFFKLDRGSQGIGLGLPLARKLAHLLGGTLRLDKTYTEGARFILTLPLSVS